MSELGTLAGHDILEEISSGPVEARYRVEDSEGTERQLRVCLSRDLRDRFIELAEAWLELEHPNISRVVDIGVSEGLPYLVEEAEGYPLRDTLSVQEPSLSTRLALLVEVAEGLRHAHSVGAAHLALGPDEIRVGDDSRPRVSGFGISQLAQEPAAGFDSSETSLEPLAYLPPESSLGKQADAAGDVFAFGILAWDVLSGHRPYPEESAGDLLGAKLAGRVGSLTEVCPGCPQAVEDLVGECLRRHPGDRPDFSEVVQRLAEIPPPADPPESPPPPAEPPSEPFGPVEKLVPAVADASPPSAEEKADGPRRPEKPAIGLGRWLGALPWTTKVLLGAVAVLALLVVLVVILIGAGGSEEERELPASTAPTTVPGESAVETASGGSGAGGTGNLRIDARPWGRLLSLEDSEGLRPGLPPLDFTPLVVEVPAGTYTAIVEGPRSAEPGSCTVRVESGESVDCVVQFFKVDANRYLQQSGWWR